MVWCGARRGWAVGLVCSVLALLAAEGGAAERGGMLHRPSPDWRDQVLYFVLTDRFADGNPRNNDQGAGEYQPGSPLHFHGGDLQGLRQKLDYVRGLGATGVWLTPPVRNQWWDGGSAGYHGYWAQDFSQVDPHLGSLADYQRLSDALHRRGMVLVQDMVVNHTGNYFYMRPQADAPGGLSWEPHRESRPTLAPTQAPFHLNDARDTAQREAGIYHWTSDVINYQDPNQVLNHQMSGLDDLNTENPVVRRALRQSYGHWIRAVGVDAYRVDTAFYVPPDYFEDLLYARDPQAPGLMAVARQTGRRDFFLFGEGFGIDKPFASTEAARIESYMHGANGQRRLPGMLNFPLYGTASDVFGRGAPTAQLADRIERMQRQHPRLHWMPSFADNHDVDRALAGSTVRGLEQHVLALMTLPGIPVIYYGTEQGFTEQRPSMFAAGRPDSQDQFNTQHPLYRRIAALTALRHAHPVLRRGWAEVVHSQSSGPGALVYRMRMRGAAGQPAADPGMLVAFNTADHPSLVAQVATGLPAGWRWVPVYGLDGLPPELKTEASGRASWVLPPHAGMVWRAQRVGVAAAARGAQGSESAVIERISPTPEGGCRAEGRLPPEQAGWQAVVDGRVDSAVAIQADADGRFSVPLETGTMIDPDLDHELVLWSPTASPPASLPARFKVNLAWQPVAELSDPLDDDRGPNGRTLYPLDPSWGPNRQLDLTGLTVAQSQGALRLAVRLRKLTQFWSPPNGFDHVMLTAFIELPGEPGGVREMPLQNDVLPDGMRWHRRLRVGGWSNALFSAEGASATHEGQPLAPGARLQVDAQRQEIVLTLPASALGGRRSLSGARIWINTWDWDGGYRPLAPEAAGYGFGGEPTSGPRWMDAIGPITLP